MKLASQVAGRNFTLALMLLLAVAASLVSFSYDADTQDDIPPVTVELKFLAQAPIVSQSAVRASVSAASASSVAIVLHPFAVNLRVPPGEAPQVSIQLSPTLRC